MANNRAEIDLIDKIVAYFEKNIFEQSVKASLNKNAKLSSYKINPILVEFLSKVLDGKYNPEGVAKALYYPRVLGTSINTTFGTQIQKMFVELGIASGSLIPGMDIEFIDKIDKRRKWCQIKSGPNTLNSEDVEPLIKKFTNTIRLANTNHAKKGKKGFTLNNTDFIVGVLYGEKSELSKHYLKIDTLHPVFTGKEFWYRVTGYPNFYNKLVKALQLSIKNFDTQDSFKTGLQKLTIEIKNSPLFTF